MAWPDGWHEAATRSWQVGFAAALFAYALSMGSVLLNFEDLWCPADGGGEDDDDGTDR